ncbi:hypothetical protein AM493_07230 [Flavobacterium akiainvivens]|uniref:Outer membrane protein beta-barrel domain-containing protein n=1 Tax=Flavobacterium akiainvivens TaxID=1202724 RepID=A0A0M8MCE2_9FLAO|nr:porin family protein [Flavobacterium akiainvivens]KOS05854.1 hypothetical protein AM493_07230 [Flavobacterium akiainvivens]SFQ56758.1 Outer membrane protein beta-barrel domain-containing protein [Flavobacterium akiainvivens]
MKNLLLAALLACGVTAAAQDYKKYSFGAGAALNISNIRGHVDEYNSTGSFSPSLFMEARLYRKLYLHIAVSYADMGGKYKPRREENDPFIEREAKLKYIAIPVKARLYVEENVFFELGPQVSFLVGDNVTETITEGDVTLSQPSNLKAREFDLGPTLSVGWRFKPDWAVQINMSRGSFNTFVNDGPAKVYNTNVQLLLNYYF